MIIGAIEGNLLGEIHIPLSRKIEHGTYHVLFEIINSDGSFYEINPSFPVFEHENVVIFTITEDYASLYMRVTVIMTYIKPDYTRYMGEEAGCNECKSLNDGWRN